jgi:diguanylate cyclase (GGDEF)-like protein
VRPTERAPARPTERAPARPRILPAKGRASVEETPAWARAQVQPAEAPAPRARTVRAAVTTRRIVRRLGGPFAAGLFAAALILLESKRLGSGLGSGLFFAGASLAFVARLGARLLGAIRPRADEDPVAPPIDLELAVLLVVGASGLALHLPGGFDGTPWGAVLLATAVIATFAARSVAVTAAIVALSIEGGVRAAPFDAGALALLGQHALLLSAIVALNAGYLRGRIEAIGQRARRRYEREVERMREQARSYRLHEGNKVDPAVDPERAQRSSVEEIQLAVRFALDLLKRSLGAHTAVLLITTDRAASQASSPERGRGRELLKLAEVVSDAPAIVEGPFGTGDGVLGAVARRRAPVNLHGLRAGERIPYYPTTGEIGAAIVAAPIVEDGVVRGVVCVDRIAPAGEEIRPFGAHDEELVVATARFILRAIENERVFGRLERAKTEQDQLYAAAQRLSGALTEAEVLEAGVESARAIASFDLAAITIVHEAFEGSGGTRREDRIHEVRAVAGAADFETLVGLRFGDNGGLVAQAVKSRCTLPHRGDHDPSAQVVFTRRHPLRIEAFDGEEDSLALLSGRDGDGYGDGLDDGLGAARTADVRSILVVPLTLHDRALGTLVLGARRRGAFRDLSLDVSRGDDPRSAAATGPRRTLEVLASHIATSLANARMLAKLEELATTDGMTGLLNKRVLLELGAQKVRAAARYGKPLAVIQTDIDLFKKINDTHGHDVGDQVIKGLAGILRRLKRSTDYVARFGGEEFVIICEETDAQGALHLAERVREELSRTTFHAATGAFHVTCSLGVATQPHDGATWDELYKATDVALYASKREGRNRTTLAPGSAAEQTRPARGTPRIAS